jgi:hypothetical protein
MGDSKHSKFHPFPVFSAVGLLLVAVSWLLYLGFTNTASTVELLADTVFAAGFAVLTVVILQMLWRAFGGDPIQRSVDRLAESASLLEDSQDTGVRRIFATSASYGSEAEWLQFLCRAKRNGQVDLMGYTLASWLTGRFEECVLELLDRGVAVRILLMGPKNELFGRRGNSRIVHQSQSDLSVDCDRTVRVVRELMKQAGDKARLIEARTVLTGSIKCSLTRVDGQLLMVPYLFSAPASSAPLIRVDKDDGGDGLFSTYKREFDALWAEPYSSPIGELDDSSTDGEVPAAVPSEQQAGDGAVPGSSSRGR